MADSRLAKSGFYFSQMKIISNKSKRQLEKILLSDYGVILNRTDFEIIAERLLRMTILAKKHHMGKLLQQITNKDKEKIPA